VRAPTKLLLESETTTLDFTFEMHRFAIKEGATGEKNFKHEKTKKTYG